MTIPRWNARLITIGTKITDVGYDQSRGLMAAFAIVGGLWMTSFCDKVSISTAPTARDCSSPIVTGDPYLSAPARCVMFAGYPWLVKVRSRAGAGTNAWSDNADNVWVDASGLYLALTQRSGQWFAARLGSTPGATGHFTVQPYTAPLHHHDCAVTESTDAWHHFEWRSQRVTFTSGSTTFTYAGADVPPPGGENVRMNLWLYKGERPATASGLAVTVSDFQFER